MKILSRLLPKSLFPIVFLLCISLAPASAQYGPNLTAGSEGLVFNQGQLDAQLILSIIASKSGEVKKELGKRLILKNLEGGSYAFYSYAEKNLNVLFNEANKTVITKELMQNSAELLLVYGLAEYLLQDIKSKRPPYDIATANLLERFYTEADSVNKKKICEVFGVLFNDSRTDSLTVAIAGLNIRLKTGERRLAGQGISKADSTSLQKELKNIRRQLDKLYKQRADHKKQLMTGTAAQTGNKSQNQVKLRAQDVQKAPEMSNGKYLLKPEIMPLLINKNRDYREPANDYYSGLTMFIDMIYDACIRNKYVISTGMFQSESRNSDRYKAMSKYWYFQYTSPGVFKDLSEFQPRVDSVINYLFQYYHLFIDYKNMAAQDMDGFYKMLHDNGLYRNIEKKIVTLPKDYMENAQRKIDSLKNLVLRDSAYRDSLVSLAFERLYNDTAPGNTIGTLMRDSLTAEIREALSVLKQAVYDSLVRSTGYPQMKQEADSLLQLAMEESKTKSDTFTRSAVDVVLDDTQVLLDSLREDVLKIGGADCKGCSRGDFTGKLEMQKKLLNIPLYIKTGNSAKEYLDLAYTLKKEYLPELTALNLQQEGGIYNTVIAQCNAIMKKMNAAAYYYMVNDSVNIKQYIHSLRNYIPLLEIINNLDRVESYDYMFKFLCEISETYGDPRSKMVARVLTNSVDKYSALNKQENKIVIDVEGMAKDIFARFAQNQQSRVYPFLTVGVNHNTALGNNFRFLSSDSAGISSQSIFVGEKIGIKLNVMDFSRKRNFNRINLNNGNTYGSGLARKTLPGKAKQRQNRASRIGVPPLVNNVHAMVYGSGLLYQIKALNSADLFTSPVLGAGAGITFFNGLDLNLTYALPASFDTRKGFFCVSFDIAIFQYLNALTQKSK